MGQEHQTVGAPLLGGKLLLGMVQLGCDERQAGVLVCQLSSQRVQPLCQHALGSLQLHNLPAEQQHSLNERFYYWTWAAKLPLAPDWAAEAT
jgi:hypothetical protein